MDGNDTPLTELISTFIAHKRALGCKYLLQEQILSRFSRYCEAEQPLSEYKIPRHFVDDWCAIKKNETVRNSDIKKCCLTVFFKYAQNKGWEVDFPAIGRHHESQYVPYIFTNGEIARIFQACDNLSPYPGSHRHHIVPVVFRLLYGCGLRESEVCALRVGDVNGKRGILNINESKFGKSRIVPVSSSLLNVLMGYFFRFNAEQAPSNPFFRSKFLNPISRGWVYRRFRDILAIAGIGHHGKGVGPRVHDLRHTFCVHSMQKMVANGQDLYCALPKLATYVGHASTHATQRYVRLAADQFEAVTQQISGSCGQAIPEVK